MLRWFMQQHMMHDTCHATIQVMSRHLDILHATNMCPETCFSGVLQGVMFHISCNMFCCVNLEIVSHCVYIY